MSLRISALHQAPALAHLAAAVSPATPLAELRGRVQAWPALRHTFSHFYLDITPWLVDLGDNRAGAVMEGPPTVWYNTRTADPRGLAAPVIRLLEALQQHRENPAP